MDSEPVMDPINGVIYISQVEKQIINTPEFQRLRGIKQLGFVNLVYPAAEHSRFIHSIGVCHRAKRIVDQVNENFKREGKYREWRKNGINKKGSEIKYEDSCITPAEKIVIALAALLHDLPHSPFSHEIESPDSNPQNGIPIHDKFESNPVFFKYLFDPKSYLARLIKIYNKEFIGVLKNENSFWWKNKFQKDVQDGIMTDDGMIILKKVERDKNGDIISKYPIQVEDEFDIENLPSLSLLGVMIYEIHLFDKPQKWAMGIPKNKPKKYDDNYNYTEVKSNWDTKKNKLFWRPLYGWFRPYRKDVVSDTICGDLVDYIERDGRNTGITATLDLKFLDRMTITRAISLDDNPTDLNIKWSDISESCEHIVFDIFDHKRGFIRDAIITEILACLQARYQLAERVYNHRVVEGARSMLQEISRLLCSVDILKIEDLHLTNSSVPKYAIGDESFLNWIINISTENISENKKSNIEKAIALAKNIRGRRIYREAIIIDGIHGYTVGTMAGPENNCKALADALLSKEIHEFIEEISSDLFKAYKGSDILPKNLVTIGVREFGKRYKVPRVLVAKPFSNLNRSKKEELEIQPLFACQDPPHIKNRLKAMRAAYDSLWRVYLFIHPVFHCEDYVAIHHDIKNKFLKYINEITKIKWRSSVSIEKLLPKEPFDVIEYISDNESEISVYKGDLLYNFVVETLKITYRKFRDPVTRGKSQSVPDNMVLKLIVKIKSERNIAELLKLEQNREITLKKLKEWKPMLEAAKEDDSGILDLAYKFIKENVGNLGSLGL